MNERTNIFHVYLHECFPSPLGSTNTYIYTNRLKYFRIILVISNCRKSDNKQNLHYKTEKNNEAVLSLHEPDWLGITNIICIQALVI